MSDEKKLCRSVGPEGQPCTKPRGHKYSDFASNPAKLHGSRGNSWTGGVRTPARHLVVDNGYRSEADYQSWMRV